MSKTIIAKNTLAQFVGRLVITAAGFSVTILIARTYGVTGFGEFTTITSLIAFGYLFVDFGLNASYLKVDPKHKYFIDFLHIRILLGVVAICFLVFPVIIAPVFGHMLFSITPPYFFGLGIYSLTILTQAVSATYNALFQAKKRYELQALSLFPGGVMLLLGVFMVTFLHLPLIAVYGAYVISGIASIIMAAYLLRERVRVKRPDRLFAVSLLQRGIPLGMLLIFNLLYFRIDTLLLSAIEGPGAVGIYGYAYKFFDFALTLPLFLSNALYPFLLGNRKNMQKGKVSEREFFFIFLILGIASAGIGTVLSPIIAIISQSFSDSVFILQILCLSLPIFFLTSYVQWLLIAKDQERSLLRIYLLGAVINVSLNMLFIPRYSYVASAVITGIGEGIVLLLLLYVLHSRKNLRKASSK